MKDKRSVVIRESYVPLFETATDEQVGKLVKAMLKYQKTGEHDIDDPMMSAVFAMIREGIDEDNEAYEETCKRRKDAANKRWGNDTSVSDSIQEHASVCKSIQEDADMELELDMGSKASKDAGDKRRARATFSAPSVEEVAAYCKERGNSVDAQAFVDFYTSKGWKVGSQQMKDWKASVRTWERRDDNKPQAPPGNKRSPRFENERGGIDYDAIQREMIRKTREKYGSANAAV